MNHKVLYLKYYKVVLSTKEVSVSRLVSQSDSQSGQSVCLSVSQVSRSVFFFCQPISLGQLLSVLYLGLAKHNHYCRIVRK